MSVHQDHFGVFLITFTVIISVFKNIARIIYRYFISFTQIPQLTVDCICLNPFTPPIYLFYSFFFFFQNHSKYVIDKPSTWNSSQVLSSWFILVTAFSIYLSFLIVRSLIPVNIRVFTVLSIGLFCVTSLLTRRLSFQPQHRGREFLGDLSSLWF